MPGLLPFLAVGSTLLGGALGAFGQIKHGNESRRAGEFNAQVLESQAAWDIQVGAEQVRRFRLAGEGLLGEQLVGYSAGGIRADEGSPLLVRAHTVRELKLNELQMQAETTRATQLTRLQGGEARRVGQVSQVQSRSTAVGTLVGSFGNVFGLGSLLK